MRTLMIGVGVLAAGAIAAAGYIGTNGSSIVPPPRAPASAAPPAAAPSAPAPVETAKAEPAKAETAKAETAKAEPAVAPAPALTPAKAAEEKPAGPRPSFDVVLLRKGSGVIAGQAEPGATVTVEAEGAVLGETVANSRGEWVMTPAETLPPGKHVLELSALPAGGERPVKGERQAVVDVPKPVGTVEAEASAGGVGSSLPVAAKAPPAAATRAQSVRVVVQPGSSLWRIARETFGAGPRYTEIWAENRTQIANPDLIYPGQVFAVPAKE